jgi:hypothetical protein
MRTPIFSQKKIISTKRILVDALPREGKEFRAVAGVRIVFFNCKTCKKIYI